jgi:hypothetical protein
VITKNNPNHAYQNKLRKYTDFAEVTNYVTLPVALSSRGTLSSRSLAVFQEIERASRSNGLLAEICSASQFALLVGLFNAFAVFLARQKSLCTDFFSAPTPPPRETASTHPTQSNISVASVPVMRQPTTHSTHSLKRLRDLGNAGASVVDPVICD